MNNISLLKLMVYKENMLPEYGLMKLFFVRDKRKLAILISEAL